MYFVPYFEHVLGFDSKDSSFFRPAALMVHPVLAYAQFEPVCVGQAYLHSRGLHAVKASVRKLSNKSVNFSVFGEVSGLANPTIHTDAEVPKPYYTYIKCSN
jgi:hypothetical protein